jgi:hypothetical protein
MNRTDRPVTVPYDVGRKKEVIMEGKSKEFSQQVDGVQSYIMNY